jgi:phage protein D
VNRIAMPATSQKTSGLPATDYFAPFFVVEVEGREVRPKSHADVVQLKVTLGIQELASCELVLNNWDEVALDFRSDFDIGRTVKIQMGYADFFTTVFFGQVTRLAPRFPDSAPPTMTVTCLDGLVKLRDRQPTQNEPRRFDNKADWQIAQEIAQRHGLGFVGTQRGPVHPLVWQKNQDDAAFLMERAGRIDFDCFIVHEAQQQRDTLFFIEPSDGRNADNTQVYTLEYQKNLTSFTPQVDVSDQVAKVIVRGWNPETKQAISAEATQADLPGASGGKTGPQASQKDFGNKEVVVDAAVATEEEARALAIGSLRDRAYKFVTGEGQMIGLPNLRPGHNLEILNVGKQFSGTYYVTGCEHIIGERGYTTTFKVRQYITEART